MRCIYILAMVYFAEIDILSAEPTARTYIFAAMESNFNDALIDSLAKYFDVVITHDDQRSYNPRFRDSTEVTWRRDEPPWVLLYKDAMTLIGPRFIGNDTIPADSTRGGGDTPGGFWHFDTLLNQNWSADTFFMLATYWTDSAGGRYDTIIIGDDTLHRVHAGSASTWQWRWSMDYGEAGWQSFYGCSTKVQCLRNYADTTYDNTYFDGIFMDNLLQYVNNYGYKMYPKQYMLDTIQGIVDSVGFRNAVYSFAQTVGVEYHSPVTPPQHGSQILGIANLG